METYRETFYAKHGDNEQHDGKPFQVVRLIEPVRLTGTPLFEVKFPDGTTAYAHRSQVLSDELLEALAERERLNIEQNAPLLVKKHAEAFVNHFLERGREGPLREWLDERSQQGIQAFLSHPEIKNILELTGGLYDWMTQDALSEAIGDYLGQLDAADPVSQCRAHSTGQ